MQVTRRTFVKATAAIGAVAALSPEMSSLKWLVEAEKALQAGPQEKVLKSACRSCAHSACEVLVHVKDGQVVKLEPDPEGILAGTLCAKGQAAIQQLYHPDRIKYPMKRVGARGEGKWQRISWEEAFDTISKKMLEIKEKYGPESAIIGLGTGRLPDRWAGDRLLRNFGSPNQLSPGHFCWCCRAYVNDLTVGQYVSQDDIEHSNCIVFPGHGCFYTAPQTTYKIDAIMKTKKFIVIDPLFIHTSAKADIWLPVRPGTDCAWALAWLNVIMGEDLYDHGFVGQWTNAPFLVIIDLKKPQRGGGEDPGPLLTEADIVKDGKPTRYMVWDEATQSLKYWDATPGPPPPPPALPFPTFVLEWEAPGIKPALFGTYKVTLKDGREVECKPAWQILSDRVKEWTPEKAAEITWIPADKIREAARTYATTKPACIVWGLATDMQVTNAQTARIICFLSAMTGNMNVKGGDWLTHFNPPGFIDIMALRPLEEYTPAKLAIKLGTETHPVLQKSLVGEYAAPDAIVNALLTGKPYKPKFMLLQTTTTLAYANQKKCWKAWGECEFIVDFDLFMSPVSQLADMVLPTSHWLEDNNIDPMYTRIHVRQRAAGPLWECMDDYECFFELGRRLGLGQPWKTSEEFFNDCIKGTGITFEEFKKVGQIPLLPALYREYEKGLLRVPPHFPYVDMKPGFATPTGKVEIYSTVLKDLGYDPLYIHYIEPFESPYSTPDLAKEYPLVLTTGARSWLFFHAEQRQIPWLRENHPVPDMFINPETAKGLGIQDGDWVWIESPRGRVRQKAVLYEGIDPRVVHARHSWWYPEKPATKENPYGLWDSNINVVTDGEHTCAITAAEPVRGLLCKVYKAVEGAPEGVWTEPEQFKPWLPKPPGAE